jgi:hypothetical protein
MMILVMVVFSFTLVAMNVFFLPSVGVLSGKTSAYQAALAEFKGLYYSGADPPQRRSNFRNKTRVSVGDGSYLLDNKDSGEDDDEEEEEEGVDDDSHLLEKDSSEGDDDDEEGDDDSHLLEKDDDTGDDDDDEEGDDDSHLLEKDDQEGDDNDQTSGEDKTSSGKDASKRDNNKAPLEEPAPGGDKATQHPKIAGLNCDRFGGPSEEITSEMVYWRDIPSDAAFVSPYKTEGEKKYLTFEPDEGGFNNIRMSMETATALAHAMGRILVLPPEQNMYLLGKDSKKENNRFTFHNFFPYNSIAEEHDAVEVISMEEFLQTEVFSGNLKDSNGKAVSPPGNVTTWEGRWHESRKYWEWFRGVTTASKWDFSQCTAVFPEKPGAESVAKMQEIFDKMDHKKQSHSLWRKYQGKPKKVNAPVEDRLQEILSFRNKICMYDTKFQDAKVMHFMGSNDSGARLLVHFYAFLFFQDWKQELWTKRYVRDHLRYIDEIQCGAARIVHAVREKAREHGDAKGVYNSMHIRRGDFQYKQTQISGDEIVSNIEGLIPDNSTVFIATDERDKKFFDPLRRRYHLYFLDDFVHLLPEGFNKNYYGMLDQRVASRGKVFAGAYFSTFTGYINRMRGYHSQKEKLDGYLEGELKSYFYVPRENRDEISTYSSLKGPLWGREFPTAWRDIDHDLEDHHIVAR